MLFDSFLKSATVNPMLDAEPTEIIGQEIIEAEAARILAELGDKGALPETEMQTHQLYTRKSSKLWALTWNNFCQP